MEKTLDQQTRIESKTRVVVRVNKCFSSGDYSSALVLLRGAAAEFPDDAEIANLGKLAQDGLKRKAEADRLITESQEKFAQQKPAEAIQLLREAYELDKNNPLSRSILANALVEHAQSIVETDWWEAETLANEALVLNPAHPTAKTIQSRVLDQKMAGSVEEWVSQTCKLQSSGSLTAALSQIAEALVVYPHDPKLLQIQDAVQRDYGAQFRQARRRDLEDLRRTASEVDAVADDASKKALTERIQAMAAKHPTDGEILSVANSLLLRLGSLEVAQKSPTAPPGSNGTTGIHDAQRPNAPEASFVAASQDPPSPVIPSRILAGVSASIVSPNTLSPNKVPSRKIAPSISPPSIVQPDKVPTTPPEQQLPPPEGVTVRVAEPSAPATRVTSQLSQPTSQPNRPARWNSATLILVSAAAMIVVATISYFVGEHHALPAAKTPAGAAAPIVSAAASSSPALSGPTLSASPQTTVEPSLPPVRLSSDTTSGKVTPDVHDAPEQKVRPRGDEEPPHILNVQRQLTPPQPQLKLASLTIQGGTPGTSVLVDQTLVGTIQPDGTLSVSTVIPGDHTVELRKERFKPRQFNKHFITGGAVFLVAADAALDTAPGELKINFAPADATVAIVKGDLLTTVSSGVALNLAAGAYTLTARTADRFTRSSALEIVAGQSKTLTLSLAPNGMSKWDDPGAWKHEGDSFIRKGGDFVLYGDVPASGTFVFSAMLTKGRLLQWVLNYTDHKNYVLFQIDENNFYRSVIRNGAKTDQIIVPDKGDKKSFRDVHIRVSPTEIVHQIRHGNSWSIVDRWTQPGTNLSLGKFGFYIPGNDQVALSGFTHYADLNLR